MGRQVVKEEKGVFGGIQKCGEKNALIEGAQFRLKKMEGIR